MIIARQKRKENISEYILYMWQVEDIIRALELDSVKIHEYVTQGYDLPAEQQEEVYQWYLDLAEQMKAERVTTRGHISDLRQLMTQLQETSDQLLKMPSQTLYSSVYFQTLPSILQLRELGGDEEISEIETCFVGIYGFLTLKARGEEVSEKTHEAIKQFSTFLAMLADRFREIEEGNIKLTPIEEQDDE
ncbi:MAG: DUF4924 family protein [Porphyromonas sp.]|nr:DUF4924 family protein [Porphyromonas sp.]